MIRSPETDSSVPSSVDSDFDPFDLDTNVEDILSLCCTCDKRLIILNHPVSPTSERRTGLFSQMFAGSDVIEFYSLSSVLNLVELSFKLSTLNHIPSTSWLPREARDQRMSRTETMSLGPWRPERDPPIPLLQLLRVYKTSASRQTASNHLPPPLKRTVLPLWNRVPSMPRIRLNLRHVPGTDSRWPFLTGK